MPDREPSFDSPWLESVPDQTRYPALQGNLETDFVVVGAGIAGVMTSWCLARKGAKVALLEKNNVATGDTGYTTAFITRLIDKPLAEVTARYGEDFARKFVAAETLAQDFLKATITRENVDCDFAETPSFTCAYETGNDFLHSEWQAFQRADPKSRLVTGKEAAAAAPPIKEAIRYEGEGRFNVRKFIFGLLKRPTASRIQVFEASGVTDVQIADKVVAKTGNGTVAAKKIIVTSGLPIVAFEELRKLVKPRVGYAIAARFPRGAPIADATFSDSLEPYNYYRRLDNNTIILGSDREPSAPEAHGELEAFLKKYYTSDFTISNAWSGSEYETTDGLPYITSHPQHKGKVLVGMGFDGNGMVQGTMAGLLLAGLATGTTNAQTSLFDFSRTNARV